MVVTPAVCVSLAVCLWVLRCVMQAGQYIKVQLVEGEVYQRLGLWVQGAPNASLQEQVRQLSQWDRAAHEACLCRLCCAAAGRCTQHSVCDAGHCALTACCLS